MRLFYDHQVFSLQNAGGAARYHYELIRHIQRIRGVSIEVVIGLNSSVYGFQQLHTSHTRVHEQRSGMRPGLLRYLANEVLTGLLAASMGKFDVYHPTLYRAMPSVRRRRVVVTNHDCAHERFPAFFRNPELVVKNKRKLYARADAIICVSNSSKRDLLQFYDVNPERVFVIHHGFSPLSSSPDDAGPNLRASSAYILYVGFRGTYKNFDMLLRAYSTSPVRHDYQLVTVGGGPFSRSELDAIEKLGVADRVKNIQSASDDSLASIYQSASLFVYPSLHEGFGFPPLEAMSVGCPVLVSSAASLPEVCGDAACYFDPTDEHELGQALECSLNANQTQSMKQRRFEHVLQYDWSEAAFQTFNIYSLVSGVDTNNGH